MIVLVHEGDAAGFWALLGLALEEGSCPDAVERTARQGLFRGREVPPERSNLLASRARVRLELADHRAPEEFELARRRGHSVDLACLRLALAIDRDGPDALDRHADPDRRAVRAAADAVRRELHRLEGLLRFKPVAGRAWLATCEPDNELVDLLAARLAPRFGSDSAGPVPFGVLDLGRGRLSGRGADGGVFTEVCLEATAAVSRLDPRSADLRAASPAAKRAPPSLPAYGPPRGGGAGRDRNPAVSRDPDEELQRAYFEAAADPARADPDLQRRFVPERYRRHLTEFQAAGSFPLGDQDDREPDPASASTPDDRNPEWLDAFLHSN